MKPSPLQRPSLALLCALFCLGACASRRRSDDTEALIATASARATPAGFGFVAVEPIQEDGSARGLGVSAVLVETLAELRSALPLLTAAQLSIAVTVQAHLLQDPATADELFSTFEAIMSRGLTLAVVPVLSADDGYFPNATNVDTYAAVVASLTSAWQARALPPAMLVVDMEPRRELIEALGSLDLAQADPAKHLDEERYARATGVFATLVDTLHAAGWKVSVTTPASLLADAHDGDDDLQQYFNVVLQGVRWDQIDFQLYRSLFAAQAPGLDAHFVYAFAQEAIARYAPTPVGVGIGLTHPGPVFPKTATLGSGEELKKDLAAALAAGVSRERITVYNLKGILHGPPVCEKLLGCAPDEYVYAENDPVSWLVSAPAPEAPTTNLATGVLRLELDAMDTLLDGSRVRAR